MTAQMFDIVFFEGEDYKLSNSTNEIPFEIESFNIEPVRTSTSCLRGFRRTFAVENKRLLIKQLDVNDKKIRGLGLSEYRPNIIYGKSPKINHPPDVDTLFEMTYQELNHEIDFTGSMLVGKTLYSGLLDHIDSTRWEQKEVYELTFINGVLISSTDMAYSLNEIRAVMNILNLRTGSDEFRQWLRTTMLGKYYKIEI